MLEGSSAKHSAYWFPLDKTNLATFILLLESLHTKQQLSQTNNRVTDKLKQ